jgi:hypothetical protein
MSCSPRRSRAGGALPWAVAAAVAPLLLFTAPLEAQTLRGILSERDTYVPIRLGSVYLTTEQRDTLSQTLTNEQGYFEFRVPEVGTYFLIASALGYRAIQSEPIEVEEGSMQVVELTMLARPVPIEGVLVPADLDAPERPGLVGTGFYDRAAAGITRGRGEFIFPGQIEASPARYTQALFWGLKTVRVHQTRPPTLLPRDPTRPRPAQDLWAVDRVGPWNDVLVIPSRVGSGYCSPSIYVDGVWLRELNAGESLADAVPKDELLAVEVYEWPFGVPQQYTGNQECGVILFWTRMQ